MSKNFEIYPCFTGCCSACLTNCARAYYTYVMLQYFMNGFTCVKELNANGDVRLFRVSLPKGEVYVAWSDGGSATLDLSRYISGKVVVHRIVTETDRNHNPVTKLGIEASSS